MGKLPNISNEETLPIALELRYLFSTEQWIQEGLEIRFFFFQELAKQNIKILSIYKHYRASLLNVFACYYITVEHLC